MTGTVEIPFSHRQPQMTLTINNNNDGDFKIIYTSIYTQLKKNRAIIRFLLDRYMQLGRELKSNQISEDIPYLIKNPT